jgi:magnesium-transporting ATPase (P-type)
MKKASNTIEKSAAKDDGTLSPRFSFSVSKIFVLLIAVCIYLAFYFTSRAQGEALAGVSRTVFVFENWGRALLVAAAVLNSLLVAHHRNVYSIFWSKAVEAKLDERERAVRNRVFLHAYRWMIVIVFIAITLSADLNAEVQTLTAWTLVILAVGLPSIIASFHKNA